MNVGWIARLFGRAERPRSEPGIENVEQLLALLPALTDPTRADAAARKLDAFVRALAPADLAALDGRIRGWMRGWWLRDAVWPVSPGAMATLAVAPETRLSVAGLMALHASGYVREAAVRWLAEQDDPRAIPFLLLRAGDWVEPVRSASQAAVRERLTDENAAGLARSLSLVAGLAAAGRPGAAELADEITGFLSTRGRAALERAVTMEEGAARRSAWVLLADTAGAELASVVALGLRNDDLVVRGRAGARARLLDSDALRDAGIVDRMLEDRTGRIRADGLALAAGYLPETPDAVFERAAGDASGAVREVARWVLRKRWRTAGAEIYRERLERECTAGVLRGLGETGDAGDAARILPHLRHERPAVRAAAVSALDRLDGDGHADELLAMLDDASPHVSRTAARVLAGRAAGVDADALARIYAGTQVEHVRENALHVMTHLPRWAALRLLLGAVHARGGTVAEAARDALRAWERGFNRRWTGHPSPTQAAALEKALHDARNKMEPELASRLRHAIRSAPPAR